MDIAIYSNQSAENTISYGQISREDLNISRLQNWFTQLNSSPVTRIQSRETEPNKQAISKIYLFTGICGKSEHLLPSPKDVLSHNIFLQGEMQFVQSQSIYCLPLKMC